MAQDERGEFACIFRTNDRGREVLAAEGYEFEGTFGAPQSDEAWTERVLVLRSPAHATRQIVGLESGLVHAETKLTALTPPRGQGKHQITDQAELLKAIDAAVKAQRSEGLLHLEWEKQTECNTPNTSAGVEAFRTTTSE